MLSNLLFLGLLQTCYKNSSELAVVAKKQPKIIGIYDLL